MTMHPKIEQRICDKIFNLHLTYMSNSTFAYVQVPKNRTVSKICVRFGLRNVCCVKFVGTEYSTLIFSTPTNYVRGSKAELLILHLPRARCGSFPSPSFLFLIGSRLLPSSFPEGPEVACKVTQEGGPKKTFSRL